MYGKKNVDEPRGVVQIAHGMNEYSGRYEAFAAYLNSLGYIVVASDHRGHGETDPETARLLGRGYVRRHRERSRASPNIIKKNIPTSNIILFGFSYGSFLSSALSRNTRCFLDGATSAAAAKTAGRSPKRATSSRRSAQSARGGRAARFVNQMIFGGYDKKMKGGEFLSVDEENNAKYHADPLLQLRVQQ